jgi:hypothetical protein
MLIVIAVVALLASIALPALNSARESSRKATCQNQLREFGAAMLSVAESQSTQLCSGALDWDHDGCVTEIGWVADLVARGVPVGKMLCPTNHAQITETYDELIHMDTTVSGFEGCVNRLGSDPVVGPGGAAIANPCRQIWALGLVPGSPERIAHVDERIFDQHYNTNYTASWFLVRSGVLLNDDGSFRERVPGCGVGLRSLNSTKGPLRLRELDNAPVSSALVPLLGDGTSNGVLSVAIGKRRPGDPAVLSFTKGPVMVTTMSEPSVSDPNWWNVWAQQTRQDYRCFAPVHRNTCNILFADMSVRTFKDHHRDGLLNSGFPANAATGFTSDTAELTDEEIEIHFSLFDRLLHKGI